MEKKNVKTNIFLWVHYFMHSMVVVMFQVEKSLQFSPNDPKGIRAVSACRVECVAICPCGVCMKPGELRCINNMRVVIFICSQTCLGLSFRPQKLRHTRGCGWRRSGLYVACTHLPVCGRWDKTIKWNLSSAFAEKNKIQELKGDRVFEGFLKRCKEKF